MFWFFSAVRVLVGFFFLLGYSLLRVCFYAQHQCIAPRCMLLCTAPMHSTVSICFPFLFVVVLMSCMLLSCAQLFACLLVRMLVTVLNAELFGFGIGSKVEKNIYADIRYFSSTL